MLTTTHFVHVVCSIGELVRHGDNGLVFNDSDQLTKQLKVHFLYLSSDHSEVYIIRVMCYYLKLYSCIQVFSAETILNCC